MNHLKIIKEHIHKKCPITFDDIDLDDHNTIIIKTLIRLINDDDYKKLLLKNYDIQQDAAIIVHLTAYNLSELYKYTITNDHKRNPLTNALLDDYTIEYIKHKYKNRNHSINLDKFPEFMDVKREVAEKILQSNLCSQNCIIRYSSIPSDEFCIINNELYPTCKYYAISVSIKKYADVHHYLLKHDFASGYYIARKTGVVHIVDSHDIVKYVLSIANE